MVSLCSNHGGIVGCVEYMVGCGVIVVDMWLVV